MNYRTVAAALLATVLAACGGGGGDTGPADPIEEFTDTAQDFTMVGTGSYTVGGYVIDRELTKPGTYVLTITGTIDSSAVVAPESVMIWFTTTGQGRATGSTDPEYAVTAAGQTSISQQVTLETTGQGPWQVGAFAALRNGTATVNVRGLTLRTSRVR